MTRRWITSPSSKDIPGSASAGYEYGRKAPIESTWLDSGGIPSNKTGIPFGLVNGLLDGVWVGSSSLEDYSIAVYCHDGDEVNLLLLATLVVSSASRIATFDAVDLGVINIPSGVQLAARLVDVVGTPPINLKVYLRPVGDAP